MSKLTRTSWSSSCSSRSITLQWRSRGLRLPAGLSPGQSHSTTISSFGSPRFPCDSFLVLLVHPLIGLGHPERRGRSCNPIKTVTVKASTCWYTNTFLERQRVLVRQQAKVERHLTLERLRVVASFLRKILMVSRVNIPYVAWIFM